MALITNHWSLDGIITLIILIITVYFYMTRNFKYWQKRGVLEITPIPFMGNFTECLILKKSPGYFLKNIYDQAKGHPYIGFYIFDKPFLLLRDHELIKNILMKDFNTFFDRYASADPSDRIGYATLFSIKNPAWKIIRTKLTPFFTSGKLKKMFGLMLECTKNLEDYLDSLKLKGEGKVIDVKDLSAKLTMNVINSTAYGLDTNPFKDPNFYKYGRMIFNNSYIRSWEILALFFLPNVVRRTRFKLFGKETTIFLRKIFWETITKRMESDTKRNDLIDILVKLKKNSSNEDIEGFKFDGDDLTAQAASFFSAGFETSAVPIAFTLYELALHPEIQNTVRNEMLQVLDDSNGKITYDMIMSLPYLDTVVFEILRMYPPLSFLNRMTMQTYKVPNSDLVLEKGTPIYIPMLGLHYDPEYFLDPYKFDPERFNEQNKHNRPSCVYLPFGEGPHACIGTRFGLILIKLTLIKILSKYEVIPCEKTLIPMVIEQGSTMTSSLNGVIYLNMREINTIN